MIKIKNKQVLIINLVFNLGISVSAYFNKLIQYLHISV